MGSTGTWVLIAIAIGTTFAGCSDYKEQEHIFQKDFRFLGDYDFEKPHQSFQSSTTINCKNSKRASQNKGTVAENRNSYGTRSYKDQGTLMNRPYKNTKGNNAEIMNVDQGTKRIQLFQRPGLLQKQVSENYPQSFDRNQEPLWFQNPKVSVEHVYDLGPKKTVDEDRPQEDNWYRSLKKLLRFMDQMHSNDDCHKHARQAEAKSNRVDGSEKEKVPKVSYSVDETIDDEEGQFDNLESPREVEPKKIIEHTKPTNMEVLAKTGVPEPLVVKVPVPHTNEAYPNMVRGSVPLPVALTIYKLVPEVMEKKIPMRVERLVPVYKPNDATMEESKSIIFRLNPPQGTI